MQEEFCVVDLWAAEAYYTALDANATKLLDMLNRGEKIHNWMLQITQEKFPVLAKDYTYKAAKQTIHALNYGVEPIRMSQESRLPITITTWQYNYYHKEFPGIQQRQIKIKRRIIKDRCLTSPLGRKRFFLAPFNDELFKQAYAWPSQSCIGEITIEALNKISWVGKLKKPWAFPALNTHDGLVIRCYINNRKEIKRLIKDAFDIPITIEGVTITIPVEIGWGNNFEDIKDIEIIKY